MSRNFAVLEKANSPLSFPPGRQEDQPEPILALPEQPSSPSGEYSELILRLFHKPAVVAIIGPPSGDMADPSSLVDHLAAQLVVSGRRVLVVPVKNLLGMNPIKAPEETDFMPGSVPNVWVWPAAAVQKIDFFKNSEPARPSTWLDALRSRFDAVLLDCPPVAADAGVAEVAGMANAAVLAVESGRTAKFQIQRDQRALQLKGVTLAGYILCMAGNR